MNLLQTSFFPFHYGVLAFQQVAATCVGNAAIKTTISLISHPSGWLFYLWRLQWIR
jgi:hypothetical protein